MFTDKAGHCSARYCGVRVLGDETGHTDNCGVCSLTKLVTAVHVTAVYVCKVMKLVILIIVVCVH